MFIRHTFGLREILIGTALLLLPGAALAAPFTGDLLVQSQAPGSLSYQIVEYLSDGTSLQTITPVQAPASSDQWHPRDLVANTSELHLYDGTFDPYLATYHAGPESWSYTTHPGWSTINNVSYGGIARSGDHVFVTNMATAGQPSQGVVAFDVADGTSQEFASGLSPIDLNLGLDGNLWVLAGNAAHAYDPVTFASLGSVSLGNTGGDNRALAIDQSGHFYIATWDGYVAHLDSSGALVDTLVIGGSLMDIDVTWDGRLAIGTRLDGAWLSDMSLSGAQQVESNRWNSFVTFVPEPGTGMLLGIGLGILARQGRAATSRRR